MNVICFSDVAWNFIWQREHHLISRLPRDWRVLFIEPSFWKSILLNIINFVCRINTPSRSDNIIVKSVPTIPFLDNFHLTRWINDRLIVFWINNLRHNVSPENPNANLLQPKIFMYHRKNW